MRVLHLFSNYKWTGPAEPAVNVCLGLRGLGIEADFACPSLGIGTEGAVAEQARRRGLEPIDAFELPKHRGIASNWRDVRKLRAYLLKHPYDIIHCHLQNDHAIATSAGRRSVEIVRTNYSGTGMLRPRIRTRLCLRRTAFLIEPSRMAMAHDRRAYGYPETQIAVVPTAIDTQRFDPDRVRSTARPSLGIADDAFVLGIVARMQRHRLFEVLLEGFRLASLSHPELHLVIVGRGTHQESVAKVPARAMGLGDRIHFPGYVSGDAYLEMINAFDVKVFMVPGSDGTCRAVREAMSMGKPAIVNRAGMLPELIQDGETGYTFDGTAGGLRTAILRALGERERVRSMGQRAREVAAREFSLDTNAARIAAIYERVLERQSGRAPRVR